MNGIAPSDSGYVFYDFMYVCLYLCGLYGYKDFLNGMHLPK